MRENLLQFSHRAAKGVVRRWRKSQYRRRESGRRKPLKLAHVSYYANGNAGDTVLSACVRRTFEQGHEDLGWNIIGVSRPVTKAMVGKINRAGALVIGGGGLFLPDTNENDVSGWQWAVAGICCG